MTREEAIQRFNGIIDAMSISVAQAKFYPTKAELDELCDMAIEALSTDADGDDLIIKGAKGIQDGLYNIKDGKLFKYKAKGGTVRTYPIVPSADAIQGEWIIREYCTNELDYHRWIEIECPFCGEKPTYEDLDNMNFCPNCGAKMKGGDDE